ncbi:SIS domain-containing protein [Clostridium sp. Marseille-Q2269]|uniref:SIS domain-containing protein n=1 Tax=Clostridium sp. Marseille-Q2269 TaxID=2942205 RepID=UPI002073A6D9|nr:SIS domain-containing protein [Clostridium sp. Marseille-Q2269]
MSKIFNIEEQTLKDLGGINTAREIYQQPEVWMETLEIIKNNRERISNYIGKRLENKDLRIILTGAGTSAFVGEVAAPYLARLLGKRVEAIHTTDIVSNPEDYLEKEIPTILVSFARSGNSPESVATYNLGENLIDDVGQLVITCNKEGALAKKAEEDDKNLVILMPEKSDDKGFAMTSSFTSMLLTTITVFDMDNLDKNIETMKYVANDASKILSEASKDIFNLVKLNYDRVIYLGSSSLKGLARESALKGLELTSGKVITSYDSVLAFRHGPKSIINDKTLVFMFMSNDEHARKYEVDLLKEISGDKGNHKVISITSERDKEVEENSYKMFVLSEECKNVKEVYLALDYILYAQMFAFLYSKELGISPDNPRPDGTVNRVVKGVIIHEYNK